MKKMLALLLITFLLNSAFAVVIKAPAVSLTDMGYVGVPINIQINVTKGDGHVFMDTMPLTELDMQGSARIAAKVAGEITGKDMNKYNTYIIVRSDVPVVGGPSAGATMTIGIICELMNWSLNKHVMMTGTINPDGSIGPVGGILEKIEAAKKANCTIMLIPKGQRFIDVDGNKVDAVEFGKKLGIKVIEVGSIYEAIPYFTNKKIVMKEYPENYIVEEKYQKIMKQLSEDVLKIANKKYENLSKELDNSYFGYEYQKMLLSELTASKTLLEKANQEYIDNKYYSATCSAFNALIKLETIEHTLKYLTGEEDVKTYLLDVQNEINYDKEVVYSKNLTVDNFEEILAGRVRISEAEELLDNAWKSYYLGHYDEAIKYGSFAKLRGESAVWWVSLYENNKSETINESKLKSLAQQYLDNAETISTYVETLYPNLVTGELENDLESAKKAYKQEDYLLAIAKSIDTCVKAEIPLVMFGDIEYLKKYSRNKINLAENLGITPISALGYYEYANSLEDNISKIMYYKYSSYYAQMDIDVIKELNKDNKESIDSEINIITNGNEKIVSANEETVTTKENNNGIAVIISAIVGGLIGFVGGYIARRASA
ncbi:serine protease-like protein [Methanocaldococcus bathoardescens]|uniref:Serine protease-like protein n=1 Tax=Methanocaldococcus bathoardescens TaxID=1301915 RepID=A0A076L9Z7_9EURY|nr:S16 family serine protease [Methanocaldococcus bathoardescens]AIJ05160.1 serine protease-like protein [Methanocaldococcus bathoardescens]